MPGLIWLTAKHMAAWTGIVGTVWAIIGGTQVLDIHALFGLVGPLTIVAIAGFFTVRSNVARIWRENYEAESERTRIAQEEAKEQRELKHTALSEVSALNLALAAERAKPDLTTVNVKLDRLIDVLERKNN